MTVNFNQCAKAATRSAAQGNLSVEPSHKEGNVLDFIPDSVRGMFGHRLAHPKNSADTLSYAGAVFRGMGQVPLNEVAVIDLRTNFKEALEELRNNPLNQWTFSAEQNKFIALFVDQFNRRTVYFSPDLKETKGWARAQVKSEQPTSSYGPLARYHADRGVAVVMACPNKSKEGLTLTPDEKPYQFHSKSPWRGWEIDLANRPDLLGTLEVKYSSIPVVELSARMKFWDALLAATRDILADHYSDPSLDIYQRGIRSSKAILSIAERLTAVDVKA